MQKVGETKRLWYRRTFEVPRGWRNRRTLLHFGAIDWEATVSSTATISARIAAATTHSPFDITSALRRRRPAGARRLRVGSDRHRHAAARQAGERAARHLVHVRHRHLADGVDRAGAPTPPSTRSRSCPTSTPACCASRVTSGARHRQTPKSWPSRSTARAKWRPRAARPGSPIDLPIRNAKLWSPDSPSLYDLKVTLASLTSGGDGVSDEVTSYFAMRKSSLCKDAAGILRLCLNNQPLFQFGPLDQGWWPDGLYTAPTDAALRYDIEVTKQLGFNMARKHVKVEPDRWYYWADRLGLLVWQDMPSSIVRGTRTPESATQFELELKEMIDERRNHPSIVMWVPFNEGWGQYDTPRIVQWIKSYDPSRLVDNASGWTDAHVGDVIDVHRYPGPGAPKLESSRAAVLGEFGGLGLPMPDHTWQSQANWSYRGFTSQADLTDAYVDLDRPPASADRIAGTLGRGLHADDRRRDRGERPHDLRPRDGQTRPRARPRREPRALHTAAGDQTDSRHLARHAGGLALHDHRAADSWMATCSTTPRGRSARPASAPATRPGASCARRGRPPTSGCADRSICRRIHGGQSAASPAPRRGRRDLRQRRARREGRRVLDRLRVPRAHTRRPRRASAGPKYARRALSPDDGRAVHRCGTGGSGACRCTIGCSADDADDYLLIATSEIACHANSTNL